MRSNIAVALLFCTTKSLRRRTVSAMLGHVPGVPVPCLAPAVRDYRGISSRNGRECPPSVQLAHVS